ncbi:MAG: ISAs1 family transposase [Bacteroidia bacterium]
MAALPVAITYFLTYFGLLEDPRDCRERLHLFFPFLTIAILGVICGADECTEIEEFGKSKQDFLAQFLDLSHGIPSHDTFGRVFSRIKPEAFQACFSAWTAQLADTFGVYFTTNQSS